jgi:putative tryptophan/tyrosine transport system substrate-binding protein
MKRREFIALLGGAAAAWPYAARAQLPAMPVIGYFSPNTASAAGPWTAAFVQRLHEFDRIEGRTMTIAYRWGEGRNDRAAEVVAEFVRLKVDVIVTHGEPNISAAKQATSVIPIVFALATDPIGSGFVASLSRPGGNVTGLSIQSPDLVGKRLELMQEIVPRVRRLAVMADGNPGTILETSAVQAAARTLGLDVVTMNIRRAEEIAPAFDTIKGRVDALYICAVPLVNTNREHISALALAARLPTVNGFREAVEAEALMSYGPNFPDLFRRTADYVEKILRGGKPADIPVEQPTKYDLVVNLKTAKALGLTIHESFLLRADEVIE